MSGRYRALSPPFDRAPPFHRAPAGEGSRRVSSAIFVALLGHGGLVAVALELPPPMPSIVDVTEVDLVPPAVASEPPAAIEQPEPALPEPSARKARAPRPRSAEPAPPPASAAPLRTVEEEVQTGGDLVRFVTDPNGTAFGFGSVARGGTAPSALATAERGAPAPAASSGRPVSLSRPPRLAESDPCRGFFPDRARVDRGEVTLKVRVERDGAVRSIAVVSEAPAGHGFGFAARDCLHTKRFLPALDRAGLEVAVVSPITVRFAR